ncbi:MAG: exodeoxyribonuclease VII large subunit, partial [Methanospirillum sp.]|nr:exodeoxyribonuclease VII large subunit [Methanospirillum sp.]
LLIERWRREMAEKGWFSPERKRTLPPYPERIGVVTSSTGAVIHDIQHVISGRFPAEIILSPAAVQGANAHEEIVSAIRRIQGLVDVLIVGRGGGSYEDLFPFNHPLVVEAIVTCPVPVVAAVGHEVDITLADLAADFSASTPSHAAEQCVPDRKGELEILSQFHRRIFHILLKRLEKAEEEMNTIREWISPGRLAREVTKRREYLADITERMVQAGTGSTHRAELLLLELKGRLGGRDPKALLSRDIPERRSSLAETRERLNGSAHTRLERWVLELRSLSATISAQGPQSMFRKGFCLVQKDGCLISSIADVRAGDAVRIRFADGIADAEIRRVHHDKNI